LRSDYKIIGKYFVPILLGKPYLGRGYAQPSKAREVAIHFVSYSAIICAAPYFCITVFFFDEMDFVISAGTKYFGMGIEWRLVILLLTQPFLQWDMYCYFRFITFACIYLYFVMNSWLQLCR
jgi:hypothetical protein